MAWNARQRTNKLAEKSKAAKEGKRYAAFMAGFKSHKAGNATNPYPATSPLHECWLNGYRYAGMESA